VASRTDEARVKRHASALQGVRWEDDRLVLAANGSVARVDILELRDPARLVLDLHGVKRVPRKPILLAGPFKQARFGKGANSSRVVLDVADGVKDVPAFRLARRARGLALVSAEQRRPKPVPVAIPIVEPSSQDALPPPPEKVAPEQIALAPEATASAESSAAGFTTTAPGYALSGAPLKKGYTGRRITLDFHDIDIRNLLRLIADVSKKNILVADDVTGKVTVSLRNVPWDQALDLVLRTKALDKEELGNVIRVAKAEQIANEREARAKAAKARVELEPLKVRLIPVNYARAGDVSSRVKDILSDRGSVNTDERTNVLIVKDVQDALVRAEGLVRNLDTQTPQVLIESRIVEASSNFVDDIGIQWGGTASFAPTTGNPTGLAFPNVLTAAGAADHTPNQGNPTFPFYAINLPAPIGQGSGGGIGMVFGSAGGAFNLNLRISALENRGLVKTISAPRIATIDNKEATIGQGLSIPFSQTSASGVNTVFIEAKLELKVTPHVTADGAILMKIIATNNAPNPQLTGANGQPSISKREANTEVLVKDGDTTVIGGIYTRQSANRENSVPLFGKIPVLGYFFRHRNSTEDYTELLIFITPRVLNRATVAQGG
jgi:type IV pilus assembly protein PilQ